MYYAETYLVTVKKERNDLLKQLKAYFEQNNDNFPFYRIYQRTLIFLAENKGQTWNLLVVFIYNDEKDRVRYQHAFRTFKTQLVRQETMLPTPGSIFPSNRKNGLIQIVEHVNVQSEFLEEFRNIMIRNNGPAMEHIILYKKWCREFIALETADILYHKTGFSHWNQIHLIAMTPKGIFRFKKDFNDGLRKVNAPSFEDNFERLTQIRHFTSKTSARRVL